MADLGTLGGFESRGNAVNAAGQVGGSSFTAHGFQHAFLYTGTRLERPLDRSRCWLDVTNPSVGANWTLFEVNGLTDNGLITGAGIYNDGPAA